MNRYDEYLVFNYNKKNLKNLIKRGEDEGGKRLKVYDEMIDAGMSQYPSSKKLGAVCVCACVGLMYVSFLI